MFPDEQLMKQRDVQQILEMSDEDFGEWYRGARISIDHQLNAYKIIGSVPHLDRGYGDMRNTYPQLKKWMQILERASQYLEKIKELRPKYLDFKTKQEKAKEEKAKEKE